MLHFQFLIWSTLVQLFTRLSEVSENRHHTMSTKTHSKQGKKKFQIDYFSCFDQKT